MVPIIEIIIIDINVTIKKELGKGMYGITYLVQKNNKQKTIKLKKEEITLIPEDYVHRLINIGNKKLKVLTIYHENSKPDYNIRFKKKFFKE